MYSNAWNHLTLLSELLDIELLEYLTMCIHKMCLQII